ncbi:pantoate--beta-alanine ligase [Thiohalobacter thiocyanaticus]|uniref:Pantothenate synthetase n=1 Tax=Thiohalobacter thiocyanaticus TaxID=585455 RepID=A0A426QLI3_9GAMM|nr:pantoate--beta-alanine ligase [Thiohalobacter thiocyanaticus]RRQ22599.1 pantoate--beta-alanine ligase [Thiohalobacter thiocyanaticus]
MKTVNTVETLREQVRAWRAAGERIGFVPTMGNLHAGHLSLVGQARAAGDRVVVSVFVNPMQFGPDEDYDSYPRTLEADRAQLEASGADLLFAPPVEQIYPLPLAEMTRVEVPQISDILCGRFRPGFFTGVATVVTKLFNMVQPDLAVFGEKDYQQLIVIRRLVRDLSLPIDIEGAPTRREPDGLAMSSRNAYLTTAERQVAPQLYHSLERLAAALLAGDRDYPALEQTGVKQLELAGFRPDYVSIRRAADLSVPGPEEPELVLLAAAWLGRARLIDNLRVRPGTAGP